MAAVVCATVGVADSAAAGAVVVVNSTGDGAWDGTPGVCETATANGVCTLRAAIGLADANSGVVIRFDIVGAGVHTIAPGSPLPDLTAPMTIDGSTQPGYAGSPLIELSGASAGASHGLTLLGGSSGSTIRGLDIVHWSASGIVIFNNGNIVAGNFIGTDPTGSTAAGNGTQGVLVYGGLGNRIGGTSASDRNVLSGNGNDGVQVQSTSPSSPTPAMGNVVEGNYVGTNAAGDAVVANAYDGISLVWGTEGNTIGGSVPGAGNLVSGNGRIGISVFDTSGGNLIAGNYVGTNAAGTAALGGNPECGIVLISGSNTVGGTSVGARNVISGNGGGCGLTIGGSGSNTVEGNYIGTNAAGTAALGNGTTGSDVPGGLGIGSPNNRIGAAAVGAGNVISGNAYPGVWFDTSRATGNVVQGNYIGTDSTATRALGNSGDGVLVGGGAQGNTIGGTAPSDGNTIAHNTSNGVEIRGGTGDPIEENSIFANSGLGIALTSGGNGSEPAPTVLSALSSGSSTTISGSAASGRRVEVFANPSCRDPEGAVFLGSTVSSSGTYSLTVPAVAVGNGITATATNPPSENTSQFSACKADTHPRSPYPQIKSRVTSRWSVHASYTTVRELAVHALPPGAAVVVRCGGRGCPLRHRRIGPKRHRHKITLTSLFAHTHLRPGTTVELDITAPTRIGEAVRYAIRSRRAPTPTRLCLPPGDSHPVACTARTFSYTGGEQTYTVPPGVHTLSITAVGAPGGGPQTCCLAAGRAAEVSGIVNVTPGQVLYVEVGGSGNSSVGGFNGGGDSPIRHGLSVYGGGGASDVRTLPMSAGVSSLNSRLIVAAGGGGSGYPAARGGDAGLAGGSAPDSFVGGGAGTQTTGGAGGCDALQTGCGMDGSLGTGGAGGSSGDGAQTREGAGGGGGLYGGGGGGGVLDGAVGGGGGGSSLVPSKPGTMSLASFTTAPAIEITPSPHRPAGKRLIGTATGSTQVTGNTATSELSGTSSLLGAFTGSGNTTSSSNTPTSFTFSGTGDLKAANGDELLLSLTGSGTLTSANTVKDVILATVTGGTGRFADASGSFTEVLSGVLNPTGPSSDTYTIKGQISY